MHLRVIQKSKFRDCQKNEHSTFRSAPALLDLYGHLWGLFSKSAYRRLAKFGEKSEYVTILQIKIASVILGKAPPKAIT